VTTFTLTNDWAHMPFPETLTAFQRMFPTDGKCAAYLEKLRWPYTFVCDKCGWKGEAYRLETRPDIFICRSCRAETSVTAGTVMHRTKMPLTTWFAAAYLVATQTPGMSAVQIQRQLGIKRNETAFQMLHKLRAAMIRPDQDRIGGDWPVEIDETYVGGKTRGEGAGAHNMAIVVGAVEVRERKTEGGNKKHKLVAGRLRLRVVANRKAKSLVPFVTESVQPRTHVTTDGWDGYNGLEAKGYDHDSLALAGKPENAELALPMIHIVFSNLKTWLQGTHHGVSEQHLQAYLNEFTFRFNRRHTPQAAFRSLLGVGTRVQGPTYQGLYKGTYEHPDQAAKVSA
jgi:transposase-like protein